MYQISIIIPVYNEAQHVKRLLKHLEAASTTQHIKEVLFVDGGSTDTTLESLNALSSTQFKIVVLESPQGRAKQMNVGAQHASGSIYYFLHVDSFPPKQFDEYILQHCQKKQQAGCFRIQFKSNHWWLKFTGWLTRFNWLICRGGDQSLFVKASLFHGLQGYNEDYTIYEDNAFIRKLYHQTNFVVIQQPLMTSARRYEEFGVWKLQYVYFKIHLKYWMGASPKELLKYYRKQFHL